jgi:hypothetical protein
VAKELKKLVKKMRKRQLLKNFATNLYDFKQMGRKIFLEEVSHCYFGLIKYESVERSPKNRIRTLNHNLALPLSNYIDLIN